MNLIELDIINNDDFNLKIVLEVITEIRQRIKYDEYSNRKLINYEIKKYTPHSIFYVNKEYDFKEIIIYRNDINYFMELLGAFVANQLDVNREYGIKYKNNFGFNARIVKKGKIHYLRIATNYDDNQFFLEKFDCRVTIANLKAILKECKVKELI